MISRGKINITGGGIAGLALALSLQRHGINYALFEKNLEITYDYVGLGLSRNIFPILKEWGILGETYQIGTEILNFYFTDKNFKKLKHFKMKSPALSVDRRAFHQLISSNLNQTCIHTGFPKSASDFPIDEITVSAEGADSELRQKIFPHLKLRDSGQVLYRGISTLELSTEFDNAYYDIIGGNLRFAIIHAGGNKYSWYAIKKKPIENGDDRKAKDYLKSLFAGYHPIVQDVIEKLAGVYISELKDLNPSDRKNLKWYKNSRVLIGDAIHPTTPNMANGACLAIEDAYVLAYLLSQSKLSMEQVFAEYQKKRENKVNVIVNQSWMMGRLMHQESELADKLIKASLRIAPQFIFDFIYSRVLR